MSPGGLLLIHQAQSSWGCHLACRHDDRTVCHEDYSTEATGFAMWPVIVQFKSRIKSYFE